MSWVGCTHSWEEAYAVDWMCSETGSDGETLSRDVAKPKRYLREHWSWQETGRLAAHMFIHSCLLPSLLHPCVSATEAILKMLSLEGDRKDCSTLRSIKG